MAHVRRNQEFLTEPEKKQYSQAIVAMKRLGLYDQYVVQHSEIAYYGHGGPSFLPWHREFLRRFEKDLLFVDPMVPLLYWDWSTDHTSIWSDAFMGGNGRSGDHKVTSGPFAFDNGAWPCLTIDIAQNYLTREFGVHAPNLPTASDVTACLAATPYDTAPWNTTSLPSFRNGLEGGIAPYIHNRVHEWVGGHMRPLSSPNDPVFFLHHANTDRLWAEWQYSHPDLTFEPQSGGPSGQNEADSMDPWGPPTTIASVLDHQALDYLYDTEKPPAQGDRMLPGDTLTAGQFLVSHNGRYTFLYGEDGNLVLFETARPQKVLWRSGTSARPTGVCIMQEDGNLVVYDPADRVIWQSGTPGNRGSRLYLLARGGIGIYRLNQTEVWAQPPLS
ncbi:tyrosinase family protein [Streptomyces sp. NPDC000983]|uniref:tyrosinase family protein n=1 Tax=Streptomyces sp. NPDC000983 TaxID=3154373 RepID=UPI00331672D1